MQSEEAQLLDTFRPEDIYDPREMERVKSAAFTLIDSLERGHAAVFARRLGELVAGLAPRDEEGVMAYRVARYWLLRLRVFAFSSLQLSEQLELLKLDIGPVLNYGFEIGAEILRYMDFFSPKAQKELANGYLNTLRENQTTLGQNQAKLTLGAWLQLYQQSFGSSRLRVFEPGAVDLLNFINTNPNVKMLTAPEKELLRSLLALYNTLLSFPAISALGGTVPVPETEPATAPAAPVYPYPVFPPPVKHTPAPTVAPVELRDRSTPGLEAGKSETRNPKSETKTKILPPAPRPPKTPSLTLPTRLPDGQARGREDRIGNTSPDDLYRSTLEELQKMRVDYEKAPSRPVAPIPPKKPVTPHPVRSGSDHLLPQGEKESGQGFSFNDALARGRPDFSAGAGQTGLTPGKDIEEKLKKLEDKIQ